MRRRLTLSCLLFLLGVLPWAAARADLAVVVNTGSGVAVLTRNEVINIFLGRYRQYFNGLEAHPVDLPDHSPERVQFYRSLLGKELADVNAYWARLEFSGRATPPPRVQHAEEVIRWVVSHPGGIGFVDSSRVDGRVRVVLELK